jgi:tetratricopeptide (TPR) repeat protein
MTSRSSLSPVLLVHAVLCGTGESVPAAEGMGGGPQKSPKELEKAAAAGDSEAQYQLAQLALGRAYRDPASREQRLPLAEKWLTRAAEKGLGEAWLELGHLCVEGGPGVLQDLARARECYRKADEMGRESVWNPLGGVFRWGKGGLAADWPRSLDYYRKAAREGDRDSQYVVGQFHEYGIGTDADLSRAVPWYTRAARQSDHWAEEKLGWLYEHGTGVPRDREQALEWYKKSKQHGGFCWLHLVRLKDPETLMQRAAHREPEPTPPPLEVSLETDKAEYELDDVIVIGIRYRNVGKQTYEFGDWHEGRFHHLFTVRDEEGRELPNPYAEPIRSRVVNAMVTCQKMEPGATWVRKHTLNQCVHLEKPGTYTVRFGESKPLALKIREGDPEKRRRDIRRLVDAYSAGKGFPEGLTPPAECYGGSLDVLQRLVFYNEPTLRPFFLDVLPHDVNSFAETGLRALPDRAGVLRALEARLEQPEKYPSLGLLYAYLRLAGLDDSDVFKERGPGRLDGWKREQEICRKYRDKALDVVRRDTRYRYAYLVPGLLGGSDDLFLVGYLIRCRPDLGLVRGCAGAIGRVKLGREHVPFLESLLGVERDWAITDAAIVQLVRLDRARYLPVLKERPKDFSPEIIKLLLEPDEE